LSLFLAERYLPLGREHLAAADAARARAASEELAREGAEIRYLGSALVPADETCFSLFEAASDTDVMRLAQRASIDYERVVEAVQIGREEE
jgi:hypothetical protein